MPEVARLNLFRILVEKVCLLPKNVHEHIIHIYVCVGSFYRREIAAVMKTSCHSIYYYLCIYVISNNYVHTRVSTTLRNF